MSKYLKTFSVFLWATVAFARTLTLTPIVTDLKQPIYFTQAPGDTDVFYAVEQAGRILKIKNGITSEFINLQTKVTSGGEMGLLGLAFHPKFQTNQKFYINYTTERPELTSVIAEFSGPEKKYSELLTLKQPFQNHNGGHLTFNKQGYLFASFGDGGSGGDPQGNGQNTQTFLGKILRIDVDKPGANKPYGIPEDNPFAKSGGLGEIYAYGLRNVWRFSFDRLTDALFAADVGQNRREEINLIELGGNYGWNKMEGTLCYKPPTQCNSSSLKPPLFDYNRAEGQSVTGGYVYRGTKLPTLTGVYVYGDYISSKIWGLTYDQSTKKLIKNELLLQAEFPISSFGEDNTGELYVVSYLGTIYRIDAVTENR